MVLLNKKMVDPVSPVADEKGMVVLNKKMVDPAGFEPATKRL